MGYPVQLVHLSGRRVLIAGGGPVAAQKLPALIAAGARVLLVAPDLDPSTRLWLEQLEGWEPREMLETDLDDAVVFIAATDDQTLNRRWAAIARARGVLVNVVDDPGACDFFAPALVRRGALTLAISSDGASPLLSAQLRRLLDAALPQSFADVAELFVDLRQRGLRGLARRGRLLAALVDPAVARLLDRGEPAEAGERVRSIATRVEEPFLPGTVAIVGAGPGGRGLLTLRGLDRIQRADVILHDALVDPEVLAEALPGTRLVDVGRRAHGAHGEWPQALTSALMIREARAGQRVVRLHAGDAFVFGRGGEETAELEHAGVAYQIVPGVSAAIAAPAAAGIPLTQRGLARGFTVRTGHGVEGYTSASLPAEEETLVVLMGLGAVAQICARLLAEGRPASTPAAAIASAWRGAEQHSVLGTLADLPARIEQAGLSSPVTLVIGRVVARARSATTKQEAAA